MILPDKVYDVVKYLVLIAIPALCTAYLGIDAAVDLPNEDAVVKIGAVVAALLGTLAGIANVQHGAASDHGRVRRGQPEGSHPEGQAARSARMSKENIS